MRILVLAIHYWPEPTGIGAVLTRRCEHLAAAGHEVTVCTGMPYYPEWRTHAAYRGKMWLREVHNGVNILRSWVWVPAKINSAKRMILEASFLTSSLLRALGSAKPDLILAVSPPLGLGLNSVLLSRWTKAPFVFDVQDLQPDAAADLGMLPGPILPILYRLEAMSYRHAALISTVTEGMRQKIVGKGVPAEKVVVVPPPADHSFFAVGKSIDGQAFRVKHNLMGKFVVAHSGNMGVKQGLDLVIDLANRLRQRHDIRFILAGDGVMRPHLQARAASLHLENLHFLPLQDKPDFLQMLAAVDLALIVQQSSVTDIVFPSKTVTLMSAGRPVAASVSADSEIARVIRQSHGGVVTEPEQVEPMANCIEDLVHASARLAGMGISARSFASEHWDEERILSSFETHLLRVAGLAPAVAEESEVAA